jgi:Flp pilus assembly protein CpaB
MQRNRPVIIAAVILGLLAIGLTAMSFFGGGGSRPTTVASAPTPVPRLMNYVAIHEIAPRTRITRNLVRQEQVDASSGPAVTLQDIEGKLAADIIYPGTPITPALLVPPIKRTTPANFEVPPNTRAIAVMIDKSQTIGDIVDVGDHVDVIVVNKVKYKDPVSQQDGESRSGRTIAQNLLVLATDDAIKQAAAPPAGAKQPLPPGATPTPPPPPPPPTPANQPAPKLRVILAALPAEAQRIAAAEEAGNIHLTIREPNAVDETPLGEAFEYPSPVLRNGGRSLIRAAKAAPNNTANMRRDISMPQMPPWQPTPPGLPPMGSGALPAPAPEPTGTEITVIRGTEKTRVIVPPKQ